MSQDEVSQVKINKQSVGLMGLKKIMEETAEAMADRSDTEVRAELVRRVSRKNYVPDPAKDQRLSKTRPIGSEDTTKVIRKSIGQMQK